jgi:hypothetical protein
MAGKVYASSEPVVANVMKNACLAFSGGELKACILFAYKLLSTASCQYSCESVEDYFYAGKSDQTLLCSFENCSHLLFLSHSLNQKCVYSEQEIFSDSGESGNISNGCLNCSLEPSEEICSRLFGDFADVTHTDKRLFNSCDQTLCSKTSLQKTAAVFRRIIWFSMDSLLAESVMQEICHSSVFVNRFMNYVRKNGGSCQQLQCHDCGMSVAKKGVSRLPLCVVVVMTLPDKLPLNYAWYVALLVAVFS